MHLDQPPLEFPPQPSASLLGLTVAAEQPEDA